jgi:hypothetical protein
MEEFIKNYVENIYKENFILADSTKNELFFESFNSIVIIQLKELNNDNLKKEYILNLEFNIILKKMIFVFGLPYFKNLEKKKEIIESSCCICLNDYTDIQKTVIYCGHSCCINCYEKIDKCPVCRTTINFNIMESNVKELKEIFDIEEFFNNVVCKKIRFRKYRFNGYDKYLKYNGNHLFLNIMRINGGI